MRTLITSHDVLEPLKQVLSASRDVMISGQICGSNREMFSTLGDGCWLPFQEIREFIGSGLRGSTIILKLHKTGKNTQEDRTKLLAWIKTFKGKKITDQDTGEDKPRDIHTKQLAA